jgi:hypothetical protein
MTRQSWIRVAYARSREEAIHQFVAWKQAGGFVPADEDMQVYWGRHADGGDYWEIIYRPRAGESDR